MNNVITKPVTNCRQMSDFIRLPRLIYQGCEQYVPDLEQDVRDTFNPRRNAGLAFCQVQPFVAYRNEVALGRIVGIINRRANEKWKCTTVRFGLIEFIDDADVAASLLHAVEQWGANQGMTHIEGPMGITDFDKEGMLVEDFDLDGSMTAIYNHPYYPRHLERLGYRKAVDWVQVRVDIPDEVPARYGRVARLASEMYGLRVRTMSRQEARGDYGRRCFELLNECYAPLYGFTAFTAEQMESFTRKYLLLVDRHMMPVVENAQGEVVGVAVTMGSLSKALKRTEGRLFPLGWWHLLRSLWWRREGHTELLLVAVRPDYQGLGVNALFFTHLIPLYNKYGIRWAETGPQLEDNVRVMTQWRPLHPEVVKRRRCYTRLIQEIQ